MSPSDDKHYPLVSNTAAPRVRRTIDARDYQLPKPYRKKKIVDGEPSVSRPRIWLPACSALVIAALVTTLVMLAKENLDSPPLLIVAAPKPATIQPTVLPMPERAAPEQKLVRARPAPPRAMAAPPALHGRDKRPPAPRRAAPPTSVAAAADPDVVLIATILMLSPPSASVPANPTLADCRATPTADKACPPIHDIKP